MPKHDSSNRHLRPDLDLLEDRRVLSSGIEVIGVSPPPAIIVIDLGQSFRPADMHAYPAAPPLPEGQAFWPSRPVWFHHEPDPWGNPFLSSPDFQGYAQIRLTRTPGEFPPPPEFRGVTSASPLFPTPAFPHSGDLAVFALPPPPITAPLGAYSSGDVQRLSADLEFMREHGPQARSLSEIILANRDGNARDPEGGISQGVSDAAHGNQGTSPAPAGGATTQTAQTASPGGVASAHLTAFLNPEAGRSNQFIQLARTNEVSVNQKAEAEHGSLPKIISANLVTAETSASAGVAGPGEDAQASALEPLAAGDQREAHLPHAAGLIAEVIPFDRASLEHAVDQFFDQLEDLGVGQLVEQGSMRVLPLSLTVIGTVAAAEVTRRRFRAKAGGGHDTRRRDPLGSEDLLGFPELPGSWSTRLT
jgi:hypothetical protein